MKKKINYIVFALGILLCIVGCSKDDLNDEIQGSSIFTEPVFKISATLGQDPINLQAGVDNFYMYTDFQEDSSAYTLIGRFAAEEGLTVPGDEELKFSLNIPNTNSIPNLNFSQVLNQADYSYFLGAQSQSEGYLYTFFPNASNNFGSLANEFFWSFDFNQTGFTSSAEVFRPNDAPFSANLTTFFDSECSSNTSGWVSPDVNSDSTFLSDISYTIDSTSNIVEFVVNNQNVTTEWDVSFLGNSISSSLVYELDLNQVNSFAAVTVRTFDQFGKMSTSIFSVRNPTTGQVEVCQSKMDYEVVEVLGPNLNIDYSVIIEYQKDGRNYSTDFNEQPTNSTITISEVEDFEINEIGLPTFKCKINFNAQLFDTDTGEARPFVGEGIIGVANPN